MKTANDTLVLLDPILLAELHRSGWRGGMTGTIPYRLAITAPVRPDHCPSSLRSELEAALCLDPVQRVSLGDVTALAEFRNVRRFLSYGEQMLLAVARSEGCWIASEGSVFLREASKLVPAEKLLSRIQLIGLAGLTFEREYARPLPPAALTGRTDLILLWQAWGEAGEAATTEAHGRLKAQGLGVVAKRDGVVIEELPDGTARPLHVERRN